MRGQVCLPVEKRGHVFLTRRGTADSRDGKYRHVFTTMSAMGNTSVSYDVGRHKPGFTRFASRPWWRHGDRVSKSDSAIRWHFPSLTLSFCPFVSLSFLPPLSVCLSVSLSVCLPLFFPLCVCLSTSLSVYLPLFPPLRVSLSASLCVLPSLSISLIH